MKNKKTSWFQKRKVEILAIVHYLLPLVFRGFVASLTPWFFIFVVALILDVLAIIVTYIRGEVVVM